MIQAKAKYYEISFAFLLPTTGGIGTIVISVIAGLGMAIFLTVFIVSKKRNSKKN